MVSLMFYSYLDGSGILSPDIKGHHIASLQGYHESLGHYVVKFPKPAKNLKKTNYLVTHTTRVDQLKEVILENMHAEAIKRGSNVQYAALAGNNVPRGKGGAETLFVNQLTVTLPYEMEVIFESGSFTDRPNTFSGDLFQRDLAEHTSNFDVKFEDVFKIHAKGFNDNEISFAKATFSNLIGGVGYFYGVSDVQSNWNEKPVKYWRVPLYTAVPSRSFFPRGFLWDEGFHNLLLNKWDMSISKDIIGHWLDLMNTEGWIPREQILGDEAKAKVPSEFVVQRNKNANPPTFFLPLQEMVKDMIKRHNSEDIDYLKHIFPRLKAWFNWYNTTQVGAVPSSYRWRGRDADSKFELNPKTLTSGLDDVPRASHPTDEERHLDLRCWIALASGIMADIAKSIGEPDGEYRDTHTFLTNNDLLNSIHWSRRDKRYCDYGLHSNKVQLVKPALKLQPGQAAPTGVNTQKIRKVIKEPEYQFINSYSYVSLFPFLLQILEPNSENLGQILTDLRDPNLLWTNYGLRSLARSAPLYNKHNTEHDPPYWRGAIWINMNFLAVRALHHYGTVPGPHQSIAKDLYKSLRANIIKNMYKQYSQTGFVWEQYNDQTGRGSGTHPFTGWSSLVVLMMAEEY
jgi:mannosyl-oligosaccharide glucosidase